MIEHVCQSDDKPLDLIGQEISVDDIRATIVWVGTCKTDGERRLAALAVDEDGRDWAAVWAPRDPTVWTNARYLNSREWECPHGVLVQDQDAEIAARIEAALRR